MYKNIDNLESIKIKLDPESDVPIYRQIAYELESVILLSKRAPDQRMPSVRKLAEQCGADPNTVQKAYKLLKDEQIIYSKPGKGYFVAPKVDQIITIKRKRVAKKIKEVAKEARAAGFWTEDLFIMISEVYDR